MNPVIGDWLTRPGGIVEQLRALRSRAGLSHRALARELDWPPSKVSKLENAKQLPTADDLRGWVAACGGDEVSADKLVDRLAEVDRIRLDWANRVATGNARVQIDHDRLARAADVIRNYEPALVPGLLQIPGYTRGILTAGYDLLGVDPVSIPRDVEARQGRQHVLYDESKRLEFIVAEPALRWRVADPHVMRAQLDRLLVLMGQDNLRFGVVPLSAQLHTVQFAGFVIYGDSLVTEDFAGEQASERGTDAYRVHSDAFDRLWNDAVEGQDARRLLVNAADDLR